MITRCPGLQGVCLPLTAAALEEYQYGPHVETRVVGVVVRRQCMSRGLETLWASERPKEVVGIELACSSGCWRRFVLLVGCPVGHPTVQLAVVG